MKFSGITSPFWVYNPEEVDYVLSTSVQELQSFQASFVYFLPLLFYVLVSPKSIRREVRRCYLCCGGLGLSSLFYHYQVTYFSQMVILAFALISIMSFVEACQVTVAPKEDFWMSLAFLASFLTPLSMVIAVTYMYLRLLKHSWILITQTQGWKKCLFLMGTTLSIGWALCMVGDFLSFPSFPASKVFAAFSLFCSLLGLQWTEPKSHSS